MNISQVMHRIREMFSPWFQQMQKEEFVFAENGNERLRIERYTAPKDCSPPLQKVSFMILDYGLVWNKDDKTALDEDELVAGTFLTGEDLPLPILALEASMHIDKYDHLNVDLFPLSQDPRYRDQFCRPVQEIVNKHQNLPGVPPGAITPNLPQGFTSGGMMSGDFDVSLRKDTLPWWFEYITLYTYFLENRDRYSLLKDPAIQQEASVTRDQFLSNFKKSTPAILADIPNLNTKERGERLGELLFGH